MNINKEAAEIFEREFRENKGYPERWVWVCTRYIYFYIGNVKDIKMLAEDIVLEIVTQTITNERKWDMAKDTIDKHIYGCIRSKVSHLYEKQKRIVEDEIYDAENEKKINIIDETAEYSKEEIEAGIDRNDFIKKCFEEVKDDTDMGLVFELLAEGKTPQEMEREYGITPDEVDAIKKRINRFLRKRFINEYYLQ